MPRKKRQLTEAQIEAVHWAVVHLTKKLGLTITTDAESHKKAWEEFTDELRYGKPAHCASEDR